MCYVLGLNQESEISSHETHPSRTRSKEIVEWLSRSSRISRHGRQDES